MSRYLTIYTDGGARGNPGPAAIGVVIEENGRVIESFGRTVGQATNNQAEYQAVAAALTYAHEHGANRVDILSDSELIVHQLAGRYKLKNKYLGQWYVKIQSLINQIGTVHFRHIRREQNSAADALVNQALDDQLPQE